MDNLDTGKDKIKKICEILKNETLEPAKEEAQKIIEAAKEQAQILLKNAKQDADQMLENAQKKIGKEKNLFETMIEQASVQAIETLKQNIESTLFNEAIVPWIKDQTKDPNMIAKLISVLIEAIQKDGISANFSAAIAKHFKPEEINKLLLENILSRLQEKSVIVGEFGGGVQLKLHDKKLTLDLSDSALKELLGKYLRKDFRALLFKTSDQS